MSLRHLWTVTRPALGSEPGGSRHCDGDTGLAVANIATVVSFQNDAGQPGSPNAARPLPQSAALDGCFVGRGPRGRRRGRSLAAAGSAKVKAGHSGLRRPSLKCHCRWAAPQRSQLLPARDRGRRIKMKMLSFAGTIFQVFNSPPVT